MMLSLIETGIAQVALADFAIRQAETASAQSVALSYYTAVSARTTYDTHTMWYNHTW